MKLPDKFYQNLTLLSLAILIAYLLSSFVLQPRVATKTTLSEVLLKGTSINEETNYSPLLIKWLLALLTGFTTVKGYEYWRTVNHHKGISPEIKKYQETLNAISSLEVKNDPPKFIRRNHAGRPAGKRILKNRNKSARFSSKQVRKIIDSSRSLFGFMVDE